MESKIKAIIEKNVKGTDSYNEEQVKLRDERIKKYESKLKEVIQKVAEKQEKEILGKVKKDIKMDILQVDNGEY